MSSLSIDSISTTLSLPIGVAEGLTVLSLGELFMIHDLKQRGLSLKAIAERSGMDRKTVRKYLRRGLTAPIYGPREPRPSKLDTFTRYLDQRISHYPELSGARLLREIREMGYTGGYSLVTDYLRDIRFVSVTSKA